MIFRSSTEGVKSEFTQVKNNVRKLQRQLENVDEEIKNQFKGFLEVSASLWSLPCLVKHIDETKKKLS